MNQTLRIQALSALMADRQMSALLAFSRAAHHVDWGDAVMLLSGHKPIGMSMVTLDREGRQNVFVTPEWDRPRAEAAGLADRVHGASHLEDLIDPVLNGLPETGQVGLIDLGMMPQPIAARVRNALGERAQDITAEIDLLSARKTDAEIANARIATEIAEKTFEHFLNIVRPGMAVFEIAGELKAHSKLLGADDNFMMLHADPHPVAVQPASCRVLEPGDLILAEITPSYRGQFTQVCRTVCMGQASNQLTEKYALLTDAMLQGIAQMRPGLPIRDVCRKIDEALTAGGYGDYCGPAFMNRRGHGLGVSSIAPGNVSLDNDTPLEPGMFLVVHPNQYIPEVGYMLCGEPVLVTEDGHEILTRRPAEMLSVGI